MTLDTSAESYFGKIPTSLATQHPDSASRYVPVQEEAAEAIDDLSPEPDGLGIEEFMVDFEGKTTPYHQTAEIAHGLLAKGLVPGRDRWITPRISNATEETVFRQLMALMSIIEADYDIFRSHHEGAIREVILPMVQHADDLIALRRRIEYLIELAHKEFGFEKNPNALQIIPLVESIPGMLGFRPLFTDYFTKSQEVGFQAYRLRVMIARSDSALSFGLVPSIIASKLLISDIYDLGEELGLRAAPILGGGSLPFRGHVTKANLTTLLASFKGVRTVTIQSGLRYDHSKEDVRSVVSQLKSSLGDDGADHRPDPIDKATKRQLTDTLLRFAYYYMERFEPLSSIVSVVSAVIPQQRDRLVSKSASGYSRTVPAPQDLAHLATGESVRRLLEQGRGAQISSVPRAISFTASLYSIGLPPEFVGLGEGLSLLVKETGQEGLDQLLEFAPGLKPDLEVARSFLALGVAESFFSRQWMTSLRRSIEKAENILGIEIMEHENRSYTTLLEIIEPLLRQSAEGYPLEPEDATLLRTCLIRLGKQRGSLG